MYYLLEYLDTFGKRYVVDIHVAKEVNYDASHYVRCSRPVYDKLIELNIRMDIKLGYCIIPEKDFIRINDIKIDESYFSEDNIEQMTRNSYITKADGLLRTKCKLLNIDIYEYVVNKDILEYNGFKFSKNSEKNDIEAIVNSEDSEIYEVMKKFLRSRSKIRNASYFYSVFNKFKKEIKESSLEQFESLYRHYQEEMYG